MKYVKKIVSTGFISSMIISPVIATELTVEDEVYHLSENHTYDSINVEENGTLIIDSEAVVNTMNTFVVGSPDGEAKLVVADGVEYTTNKLYVCFGAEANGSLEVAGGNTIIITTGTTIGGNPDNMGHMLISDGAKEVSSPDGVGDFIGAGGGTGELKIDDAGSKWISQTSMNIGSYNPNSVGLLSLTNDETLTSDNINLGDSSGGYGLIFIGRDDLLSPETVGDINF